MKHALIIVNKKSGTGDKKHVANLIHHQMDRTVFDYELIFTQYKGHATELSQRAVKDEFDMVIIVGGDGSVNEVARSLIHTNTVLGIIPMGSGNGLARSLEIPLNPSKAIAVINQYHIRTIDVGFANDHLFVSNAGVGFDAVVAKEFEHSRRRGLLSYIFTIMRSLATFKPAFYELDTDGGKKQTKKAFFIGIANGNQLGYNFKIAPNATPYDGLLDVCMIGPIPKWKLPLAAMKAYNGRLPQSRYVEYLRCKELNIQMKENTDWMQTDGDAVALEENKMKVTIESQALKIVVP